MRESRIGIDIDSHNRFNMLKTFFNARQYGDVKVYQTRHGYHIKVCTSQYTIKERLHIRAMLGDDSERLAYDELKLSMGLTEYIDTLFEVKKDRYGEGHEEEVNPLSEQYYGLGAKGGDKP